MATIFWRYTRKHSCKALREYETESENYHTAKAYTYQDKLAYIDVCRKHLHRADDTGSCVRELMKDLLEYQVTEQGEIPDKEDYLSVEFMENCYDAGRTNLYARYTGNHHIDDKIMDLLVRAIKVVINYEG